MRRQSLILLCSVICAVHLLPARPLAASTFGDRAALSQGQLRLAQYRQCSQRAGPFATQTTAWQRWREARAQGYAVSQGVVPCYWGDTRGYCFNVFRSC